MIELESLEASESANHPVLSLAPMIGLISFTATGERVKDIPREYLNSSLEW